MNSPVRWSLNWGQWGGVRVRLHASFLVMVVVAVYVGARVHNDVSWYGLMAAGILLASVIIHELGHLLAARRMGGSVDLIVLGPIGGLQPPHVPREPQRELTVALAGPLANLLVMIIVAIPLAIEGTNLGDILLRPMAPGRLLSGGAGFVALKMTFWLNWLLLAANLIPAAPFDGGYALRSVLWPVMGYRGAVHVVSRSGLLVALGLCVTAWLLHVPHEYPVIPMWVPLVLLAIYIYFNSRIDSQRLEDEDEDDDVFGYDFSQGYTSLDRAAAPPMPRQPGVLRRWLKKRQEQKQLRLREIEREEERCVDDVLVRLKQVGFSALSPEERALLQRVSARYRNRPQA